MPRQARIDYPGALHHVMGKGIEGKNIFEEEQDKQLFYALIKEILSKSSMQLYAWCIMSNHFHLLMQTGKTPLSTFMRRLLTGYAVKYNKKHKRSGYLFQNRYKSIVCDKDEYLLPLVRYIHLNPVKAGLIEFKQLSGYKWTGHREIMRGDGIIARDEVIGYFGKKEAQAKREYDDYVKEGLDLKEDFSGGGLIRSVGGIRKILELKRGPGQCYDERILGDGDFVSGVLKQIEEEQKEKIFKDIDEVLGVLSKFYQVEAEEIIKSRRARVREARSVLIYIAHEYLGYTVTEIGKKLKIKQAAASIAMQKGECVVREKGLISKLKSKL